MTKPNAETISKDGASSAQDATNEKMASAEVIPPLGHIKSKGMNMRAIMVMSIIGAVMLAMFYFYFQNKTGQKKAVVKELPLEQVVIPERKRLNTPLPPSQSASDAQAIALRGANMAAIMPMPAPAASNEYRPPGGMEPISLALKRALQGGAVFTSEQTGENPSNRSAPNVNSNPELNNISEAEAIIRRRTKYSGSVVDFLGGVPRSQSPAAQQPNGFGQRVDSGGGSGSGSGSGSGGTQGLLNIASQFAGSAPGTQAFAGNSASQTAAESSATVFPVKPARQIPLSADTYISQGTNIRCVMQMRLISTLDAPTACDVADNIYAANATKVLIPKGSRILGDYKEGKGTERVSIIWNRLITPSGTDVALSGSIGTDSLGSAGVPGQLNSHWGEKLGAALLISLGSDIFKYTVITKGPKVKKNVIDTNSGRVTSIEEPFESATVDTLSKLPEKLLAKSLTKPDTVTINQGTLINIVTARDLDFSPVN